MLIAVLTSIVMRSKPVRTVDNASADESAWPSLAQQHADAIESLLSDGAGTIDTEIVVHVRADGCELDDGTPITDSKVASLIPQSLIRALIHDIGGKPVNATGRRRHPNTRQKRVLKERDRVCVDCGRNELLQYDHVPDYDQTHRTHTDELRLRCAPCHHARHSAE